MTTNFQPGQLVYCEADNHYYGIGLVLRDETYADHRPYVFSVLLNNGVWKFCDFELTHANFQDSHAD